MQYDFDVYGLAPYFEGIDERIKNSEMLPENKEAALAFKRKVYAAGLMSERRLIKYENWIKNFDCFLGKPFSQVTKEDLEDVLMKVKQKDWKDSTKADFRVMLKRYYKVMYADPAEKEYPEIVKWIKAPKVKFPPMNFDDCPTWDDVVKMSEKAFNLRDKAFILCLWEGGLRIQEALTLKVGSVEQVQHGVYLNIQQSKTKLRPVFIHLSERALSTWLNVHPLRQDKEAPLFCKIEKAEYHKAMSYRYSNKLLRRLGEKAGIKKDLNPHNFRHGSASYFSDLLSDSDMDMKYGWVYGSPHKGRYQHKHKKAIEAKVLKAAGIYEDSEVKNIFQEQDHDATECYYCKEKNHKTAKTCWKCQRILDISLSKEVQALAESADRLTAKVLGQHPEVLKALADEISSRAQAAKP